jgi:hypothetical protein
MRTCFTAASLTLSIAWGASAQTSIDPSNKHCWQENVGWLNWADADGGAQGVRDRGTALSGFIWGENIGWINVGNGPAGGVHYTNVDHTSFGVNISPTGALSGFAWGENIGWINFGGGALASPPNAARLDLADSRFRGYAWGENVGWINLDDATKFVKEICYANCDGSTTSPVLNVADFTCFLQKYAAADAAANCDRSETSPVLNVADFTCFLQKYAAGCS